jgi:hypothetical protein
MRKSTLIIYGFILFNLTCSNVFSQPLDKQSKGDTTAVKHFIEKYITSLNNYAQNNYPISERLIIEKEYFLNEGEGNVVLDFPTIQPKESDLIRDYLTSMKNNSIILQYNVESIEILQCSLKDDSFYGVKIDKIIVNKKTNKILSTKEIISTSIDENQNIKINFILSSIFPATYNATLCQPMNVKPPLDVKIITDEATAILQNSAVIKAKIEVNSPVLPTESGVLWSYRSDVDINANKVKTTNDVNNLSLVISSLNAETSILFRDYLIEYGKNILGENTSFKKKADIKIGIVSTRNSNFIKENEALIFGEVLDTGGDSLAQRGFVLDINPSPTYSDKMIPVSGDLKGLFSYLFTELAPDQLYYVRAFIKNLAGISYGNEISFKTPTAPVPPVVTTSTISKVSSTTIAVGGIISNSKNDEIIESGIYISLDVYFIKEVKKILNPNVENLNFLLTITDLSPGKTYWVKAFATNSAGISYGTPASIYLSNLAPTKEIKKKETNDVEKTIKSPSLILTLSPYFQNADLNQYWLRNNENPLNSDLQYSKALSEIITNNNFSFSLDFNSYKVAIRGKRFNKVFFNLNYSKASFILEERNKYALRYPVLSANLLPVSDAKDIFLDMENIGLGVSFKHVRSFLSLFIQSGVHFSNLTLRFQKEKYHFNYKIAPEVESYLNSKKAFLNIDTQEEINVYGNLFLGLGWRRGISLKLGVGFNTMSYPNPPNHTLYNALYLDDPIPNTTFKFVPNLRASFSIAL